MRFAHDNAAALSAPHSSLIARLGAGLRRAITTPRLWARRRHERHGLLRLDDHMLRDIGFERVQANEMATRPFWRA